MRHRVLAALTAVALLSGCTPVATPDGQAEPVETGQETQIPVTEIEKPTESIDQETNQAEQAQENTGQGEEEIELEESDETIAAEAAEAAADEAADDVSQESVPVEEGQEETGETTEDTQQTKKPERQRIESVHDIPTARQAVTMGLDLYQELLAYSQDGQVLEVETAYWTQSYVLLPVYYTSLDDVRSDLELYFTPQAADQIIHQIHLFEWKDRVGLPEQHSPKFWNMENMTITPWDQEKGTYLLTTTGAYAEEPSKYELQISRTEKGDRINTVPGAGRIEVVKGSLIIKEAYQSVRGMEIRTPVFVGPGADKLNASLQEHMLSFDAWKAEVDKWNADAQNGLMDDVTGVGLPNYEVWQYWELLQVDAPLLVLSIGISDYAQGAAHPNHGKQVVTLNMETGEAISLQALFTQPDKAYAAMENYIVTYLQEENENFYADADILFEGLGEHRAYNWNDKGLMILFSQYEVAPYAAGFPIITIPWDELQDLLKPEYREIMIPSAKTEG